jgi:hypothetical protein
MRNETVCCLQDEQKNNGMARVGTVVCEMWRVVGVRWRCCVVCLMRVAYGAWMVVFVVHLEVKPNHMRNNIYDL